MRETLDASVGGLPDSKAWALTATDRRVLGWLGVNLLVFGHVVAFETPLWLTYAYNGLLYVIGIGVALRSPGIRDIFVLGSVAGVLEVGVDAFLVSTGSLVYPDSLPMLLGSPLYMPIAWALVVTYFGYFGRRLDEIAGPVAATLGPAVTLDATDCVIVSDTHVAVAGVDELVVASFDGRTVVVPRDDAQRVREIVSELDDY